MSYKLCGKVKNLEPYEPNCGRYGIKMDANESWLPLPRNIKKELMRALEKTAFNRYPDPTAERLCRAAAAYYGVGEGNITAGNGSDELIGLIISCLLQKGGRVLTFTPDFSMYGFYSSLHEMERIVMDKDPDLPFDCERVLERLNGNNMDMLIFSNPCNPTSLGVSRRDVLRIVEGTGALVVVDEAYMDFWSESVTGAYDRYDNLIVLRTCSKAMGLAGIRLGFAIAGKTLTKALRAVKSPYNVSALTQAIGCEIFLHAEYICASIAQMAAAAARLCERLSVLAANKEEITKVYPTNTNFVYMRLQDAARVFEALKAEGIIVRRLGDCLRITAGSERDGALLLACLEKILK